MAMACCAHCGHVESVVGYVEPIAGRVYRPCPECGSQIRWMPETQAIDLARAHPWTGQRSTMLDARHLGHTGGELEGNA